MGQSASADKIQVHGSCDENYEPVKKHLEKMLTKGKEDNVQLCVYVDGNCVIDLYATATGDTNYNADKIQVGTYVYFLKTALPKRTLSNNF